MLIRNPDGLLTDAGGVFSEKQIWDEFLSGPDYEFARSFGYFEDFASEEELIVRLTEHIGAFFMDKHGTSFIYDRIPAAQEFLSRHPELVAMRSQASCPEPA